MSKYEKIKSEFENHADRERAAGMKKYMRDQFEFYGIPAMERKKTWTTRTMVQMLYIEMCLT